MASLSLPVGKVRWLCLAPWLGPTPLWAHQHHPTMPKAAAGSGWEQKQNCGEEGERGSREQSWHAAELSSWNGCDAGHPACSW